MLYKTYHSKNVENQRPEGHHSPLVEKDIMVLQSAIEK